MYFRNKTNFWLSQDESKGYEDNGVWGNVRRKSWEEGRRMAFVSGLEF